MVEYGTNPRLEFHWTVSRGRNTCGYNICSLYVNGRKVSACNGGGYDMKGTSLGHWIAKHYADRLRALPVEKFPENSHWVSDDTAYVCWDCIRKSWGNSPDRYRVKTSKWDDPRPNCPGCGEFMSHDSHAGHRENTGRGFYGLSFHDPDYDPGRAVVGKDCSDRTLGKGSEGKTVEEAEKAGESLGLERYQAFYTASAKTPSKTHRIPLIDGACGFSSVERIMEAIGLSLEYVATRSKKTSVYILHDKEVKDETHSDPS